MRRYLWLAVGLVAFAPIDNQGLGQAKIDNPALKERAAIARERFEELVRSTAEALVDPPHNDEGVEEYIKKSILTEERAESLGKWSRRWMQAERDMASDDNARQAAVKAHRDRLRDLEKGSVLKLWLEDRVKPEPTKVIYLKFMMMFPNFSETVHYLRLEAETEEVSADQS